MLPPLDAQQGAPIVIGCDVVRAVGLLDGPLAAAEFTADIQPVVESTARLNSHFDSRLRWIKLEPYVRIRHPNQADDRNQSDVATVEIAHAHAHRDVGENR